MSTLCDAASELVGVGADIIRPYGDAIGLFVLFVRSCRAHRHFLSFAEERKQRLLVPATRIYTAVYHHRCPARVLYLTILWSGQ